MKKIATSLLLVLVAGCGDDSPNVKLPVEPAEHVDSVNGVRFKLPGGWIVKQGKTGLTFMAPTPDDQDPAVGYTKPLPTLNGKPMDFKTAATLAKLNLTKAEPSAKDVKTEPMNVLGAEGLLLSFNLKMEDSAYRSKQVYAGGAGGGCLVQFMYPTAQESTYAPVFAMILESLTLPKK